MFNFTTQTLVRDEKNVIINQKNSAVDNIIINGVELPKKNVRYISVFKQEPIAGTNAKVTLNLTDLVFTNNVGRIAIQIKLSNSSVDPLFANNMVYRGKPIYAEFKVAGSKLTYNEIDKIAKTLNKVSTFDSQILKATANDATEEVNGVTTPKFELIIECKENYMNFDSVKVQNFDETKDSCCHYDEKFEDLTVTILDNNKLEGNTPQPAEFPVRGVEEFGTYKWILHNLRIPTDASQAYNGQLSTMGELPAPGEMYTQYTIKMEADRENIGGMVVGEKTTSVTTHVFYVKNNFNYVFEGVNYNFDQLMGLITPTLKNFTPITTNGSVLNINGDLADVQGLSVLGNDTNLQED